MKFNDNTVTAFGTFDNYNYAVDDSSVSSESVWSSKNTVDKLCPAFTESGAVVTCEPVEGYPLEVATDAAAVKVFHCGKNLFSTTLELGTWNFSNKTKNTNASYARTADLVAVAPCAELIFSGTATYSWSGNMAFYDKDKKYLGDSRQIYSFNTFTVPEDACYIAFHMPISSYGVNVNVDGTVQLEVGTTKTTYEQYNGGGEFSPNDTVSALFGINTIWANKGNVTVTGRADPAAIIKKLTNAIIATGGNI